MSDIIILNELNYSEETSKGIVIVDFYADWCAPCKRMAPIFEEAREAYEGRVVFAKLDIDASKPLAVSNRVLGVPTLIFYKNGEIVDRVTGVIEKSVLYEKIDAVL